MSEPSFWLQQNIAFISALVLLFAGYLVKAWFDRREQIKKRHFDIYVEMIEAICEMANAFNRDGEGFDDALAAYFTAKMKFAVVASDTTMQKLVAFDQKITAKTKVPHDEFDGILAALMKAIREENLGKTQISETDLISVTPFGRSIRDRNRNS
ncbi:hypothetical protein [Ruegeria intermedia]|uniref:hypothetical protein n=1 Tax=Ruegeria intermedia TaxID=996115 RepID=UPI00122C19D2|nr:hypothetical protein [Ruegeria intermedia]